MMIIAHICEGLKLGVRFITTFTILPIAKVAEHLSNDVLINASIQMPHWAGIVRSYANTIISESATK